MSDSGSVAHTLIVSTAHDPEQGLRGLSPMSSMRAGDNGRALLGLRQSGTGAIMMQLYNIQLREEPVDLEMQSRIPALVFAITVLSLVLNVSCGREESARESRELGERLEKLRSVPYTSVTSDRVSAEIAGVTRHDTAGTWPGYNLYCSRIAPEAFLFDTDGNIVNRWYYKHDRFRFWNYALLLDNGELIVLSESQYIFKLDWNSNLVWEQARQVNHDVARAADGSIYVIERVTKTHRNLTVRFGQIAHLDTRGEELGIWSTYDRLDYLKRELDPASFLDTVVDTMFARGISLDTLERVPGKLDVASSGKRARLYDYFRLNTVTVMPETRLSLKDKRFAAGHLLICLRNVNQIAVLDWTSGDILWSWGEGDLEWPHHPTVLENGNILIFDNGVLREYSRVIELNPITGAIEWEYIGDPPESFYSRTRGSSQRLPNGNTLICESNDGRAFEVTRDGEIVWEWFNPIIDDDRRVQVYRLIRYPVEMVEPLLRRK